MHLVTLRCTKILSGVLIMKGWTTQHKDKRYKIESSHSRPSSQNFGNIFFHPPLISHHWEPFFYFLTVPEFSIARVGFNWEKEACIYLFSFLLCDMVSANGASCNKKSDGSQDALRVSPDIPNEPLCQ